MRNFLDFINKLKLKCAVDYTASYSGGTEPDDYVPTTIEEVGNMIEKVAEQVIRGVEGKNPLTIFEKMPVDNGGTIEQSVVELAESEAYDKQGLNALTREDPTIAVRYFNCWKRAKFHKSVDISQIRKVLLTGKGADEIASKIVASLSNGDTHEKFGAIKGLLKWGRQDQTGKVLVKSPTIAYDNGINYEGVLVALKDIVDGMSFVNADFNTAQIERSTNKEDIVIVMPYKLKNKLDVEELSGVFNLDKAELKDKIITVDVDAETIDGVASYPVYVVDKFAVLVYTRLYEMLDQKNADGLFWNYFLHTERLYALSPLFDGTYFLVETEASA